MLERDGGADHTADMNVIAVYTGDGGLICVGVEVKLTKEGETHKEEV